MDTLINLLTNNSVTLVLLTVILIVFLTLIIRNKQKHYDNLPPGPTPLPLIGTIYKHGINPSPETLLKLSEEYGDIFCLYFGFQRVIVLNSYEAIKAARAKPTEFLHRGMGDKYTWLTCRSDKLYGLGCKDYTEQFVKERSLSIGIMRNLGIGKTVIEEVILQEIDALAGLYSSVEEGGRVIDPEGSVSTSFANIMLHILLDKRFEHGDSRVTNVLQHADNFMQGILSVTLIDNIPILRFISPFKETLNRFIAGTCGLYEFVDKKTHHIFDDFHVGNTSCFVENWAEHHFDKSTKLVNCDRTALNYILVDLVTAGLETSATLIRWLFVILANRPNNQQRLFDEIEGTIGLDRYVRLSDKEHLPYLEATLWELMRYVTVAPLVPHESTSTRDNTLMGFDVPKRSTLVTSIYGVHMNEKTWQDPKIFRPERFLDDVTGKFVKHDHVIPWLTGKRMCPGEILARQESFLYAANLIQRFRFSPPDGVGGIDETKVFGFCICPKPYKVKITPRER